MEYQALTWRVFLPCLLLAEKRHSVCLVILYHICLISVMVHLTFSFVCLLVVLAIQDVHYTMKWWNLVYQTCLSVGSLSILRFSLAMQSWKFSNVASSHASLPFLAEPFPVEVFCNRLDSLQFLNMSFLLALSIFHPYNGFPSFSLQLLKHFTVSFLEWLTFIYPKFWACVDVRLQEIFWRYLWFGEQVI